MEHFRLHKIFDDHTGRPAAATLAGAAGDHPPQSARTAHTISHTPSVCQCVRQPCVKPLTWMPLTLLLLHGQLQLPLELLVLLIHPGRCRDDAVQRLGRHRLLAGAPRSTANACAHTAQCCPRRWRRCGCVHGTRSRRHRRCCCACGAAAGGAWCERLLDLLHQVRVVLAQAPHRVLQAVHGCLQDAQIHTAVKSTYYACTGVRRWASSRWQHTAPHGHNALRPTFVCCSSSMSVCLSLSSCSACALLACTSLPIRSSSAA